MYTQVSRLLSDIKGGPVFVCFDIWHICYILLFVGIAVFGFLYLRNKDSKVRKSFIDGFVIAAFALYIADFFLMPFAYGEISVLDRFHFKCRPQKGHHPNGWCSF